MTIQWTLVAAFLYGELSFISFLLLPMISPFLWGFIFQSRFCRMISEKANLYFSIFIAVLLLFFLDSIREMHKYSGLSEHDYAELGSEIQRHMKLFRAQRNFYISGFALFLWFVIRRLVTLIMNQVYLLISNENSMRAAQSATETTQKLLRENEQKSKIESVCNESFNQEINSLQERIIATKNELDTTKSELTTVKNRAESVSKEYDQLLQNYTESQTKCTDLLEKEE